MIIKSNKVIHYSEKELEYFRGRWKTEDGKERRRRIIQIMRTGSTEFGDLTVFPDKKNKFTESIPTGKDLRGINIASVEIPQGLNFTRFHFSGAILEASDLSFANFSFSHLEYTSFNGSILNHTIFKGANMVLTTFVGANMDMAIFAEAVVDGYQLMAHKTFMEDGFRDFSLKFGFIDKKPGFYNMIKLKYKELGRYDEMIPFHILEMRSKRDEKFILEREVNKNGKSVIKRYRTPLWFIEKLFFDICFGYGEKWYRVLITAVSVVLTFSFLYMLEPLKSNWDQKTTSTKWIDTIYFSAVNFTNLGSQDWLPGGPLHRLLMGIESISGLFLTTLIIVIFTRKMIRE
jgi:hypothetical protein